MKTKSRLALLLCGSALSGTAMAGNLCDVNYVIQHSWQTGAVHRVQIDYNGPETTGWQLSWRFPGQERIDSIFNVTPDQQGAAVTVTSLDWNARIRPGSELKFGFNVNNPSGEVPTEFFLNGERCGAPVDEPSDPDPVQPDPVDPTPEDPVPEDPTPEDPTPEDPVPEDPAPVDPDPQDPDPEQPDPSDPTAAGNWMLDSSHSYLGFLSAKNLHNVEAHSFGELSGVVTEEGIASLTIRMESVDTGIEIRDQRMRTLLFDVNAFPETTIALELGDNLSQVLGMSAGEVLQLDVPALAEINGEARELNVSLQVERLSQQTFVVSSARPVLITADQFGLQGGVEALREVAGLSSISLAVPVDFALFFKADQRPTP